MGPEDLAVHMAKGSHGSTFGGNPLGASPAINPSVREFFRLKTELLGEVADEVVALHLQDSRDPTVGENPVRAAT